MASSTNAILLLVVLISTVYIIICVNHVKHVNDITFPYIHVIYG